MKTPTHKGFTLIELLVVITIIGILATGGITVYTSQIQKARDTVRIKDIKALKGAIEQAYQDEYEYPNATTGFYTSVKAYMSLLPKDPKHGQGCGTGGTTTGTTTKSSQPECNYVYNVAEDDNGIDKGAYEISTAFESKGNIKGKAKNDGGDDSLRLEDGVGIATSTASGNAPIDTSRAYTTNDATNVGIFSNSTTAKTSAGNSASTSNSTGIVIVGNPDTTATTDTPSS